MLNLSSQDNSLSNYQILLDESQRLLNVLSCAIDDLESAATSIESCYSIDDISADANQIAKCRKQMQDSRNFLRNTAIPSIIQNMEQVQDEN